jgi:hypothetical protein
MIVELVTFKATPGADWDGILRDARAVIPHWQANPDLLRKHFLLSDDGRECGGLYVWPTREAAEAAHDAAWRAGIERRTGSPPTIRYFQLQMLIDNEAGTVVEWSKTGEKVTRSTSGTR